MLDLLCTALCTTISPLRSELRRVSGWIRRVHASVLARVQNLVAFTHYPIIEVGYWIVVAFLQTGDAGYIHSNLV